MKNTICLWLVFVCIGKAGGQTVADLEKKLSVYEAKISIYKDSIARAKMQIENLRVAEMKNIGHLKTVIKNKTYVAEDVNGDYRTIGYLYPGDSVTLYGVKDYRFYASGKGLTGYIGSTAVPKTKETDDFYFAMQKKEMEEYQNTKQKSGKSVSPNYNYSSGSSSGKTIHAGPRGGQYYINKNGKKTYVKKK
jgi:hypothetical protein